MTDSGGSLPVREDASLPLFEPPGDGPVPRIGVLDPELVIVATAAARPYFLQGTSAVVGGLESRAACEVRFPSVPLLTTVAREIGVVANTMLSPGRLRRERVGRGSSLIEAVLVAPGQPLVIFDWSAGAVARTTGAGDAPVEILVRPESGTVSSAEREEAEHPGAGRGGAERGEVEHGEVERGGADPPSDRAIRYRVGAHAVTFALGPGPVGPAAAGTPVPDGSTPDPVVVVALSGAAAPPRWTVEGAPRGGIRCSTGATDATTLLVVAGPPEAVRTALRASAHATVHERRAVAAADHGSVTLVSGVAEVDDGFAWASTRLALGVRSVDPAEGSDGAPGLLWSGLASVALGDEEAAAACLRVLSDAGEAGAAALLAGRLALGTGRVQEALACADLALGGRRGAGGAGLSRAGAAALADGLRYAMPDEALERLRALGASTRPPPASPHASGGRSLPTLGGGPGEPGAAPDTSWLGDLFAGWTHGPPGTAVSPSPVGSAASAAGVPPHAAEAFLAWAALQADPDAGWVAWRGLVSGGLAGTLYGAGAWDDPGSHDPPAAAALLTLGMLHGVLGVLPDAPVGRLRLAPRLPAHLTRFGVRGLPIGDARVDVDYVGTPDRHRFVIRLGRGRVPPQVVFEPSVPGAVREVRVDGAPTDVELVRVGARTRFRLQTPLDAERTIDAIRAT